MDEDDDESEDRPSSPESLNMDCFRISRATETLAFSVPEAGPFVRRLLRVAGRVIIDAGGAASDPALWPATEVMALQWLQEALAPLGYDVRPGAGSDRQPVPDPSADW